MKQRGKIFATLLVLALCMGGNLYAERARHIGVTNTGDLNLTLPQQMGITDAISRSDVRFNDLGDRTRITVGNRTLLVYASGIVPLGEPDTYRDLGARNFVEDPISGMPMFANGAIRIRDFTEDPASPQEQATVQSNEFDVRLEWFQDGVRRMESQGIDYTTIDVGGVDVRMWANGAVLLDPELPSRLTQMDPQNAARLPVAVPQFLIHNDSLLFANGSVRRNLPE